MYSQTVGFMFRDQLGSVRGVVEGTDWVERGVYRPFGDSVEWVEPTEDPESHNYIGERRDDTGLMYLNARYYDPALGHFLSPDWFPVEMRGVGPHRYHYSHFDPINLRDPNGNTPFLLIPLTAAFIFAPDPVNDETGEIPGGLESVLSITTPLGAIEDLSDAEGATEIATIVGMEVIGPLGDVLGPLLRVRRSSDELTAQSPIARDALREQLSDEARVAHAWEGHADEFRRIGVNSVDELADLQDRIRAQPTARRDFDNGRVEYWDETTRTIVIVNPNDRDGGTIFRPGEGRAYFDRLGASGGRLTEY